MALLTSRAVLWRSPANSAKAPSDDTHSEAARKAGTVLLVEDDLDVAEVTAALLEECGYAVKLTYRSSEALNVLLQGKRVDLVLSDIMMPGGMNGMQLAEVRSVLPELPVLLATGYSDAAADAVSRGLPITPSLTRWRSCVPASASSQVKRRTTGLRTPPAGNEGNF
jgi:CheY-like chemotaxis protein